MVPSLPIFQAQPNICINREVKGTRNFRQWQEYHCSCDLSDHRKDFILESFLSLFSECAVIFGSLVTISNYRLSRTLSIFERTATTFFTELLYNPTFSCPTLFRYFMGSEWVVKVKVSPHFCTRVKFSSGYMPRWYHMLLMSNKNSAMISVLVQGGAPLRGDLQDHGQIHRRASPLTGWWQGLRQLPVI